jgi:hypothetical protein
MHFGILKTQAVKVILVYVLFIYKRSTNIQAIIILTLQAIFTRLASFNDPGCFHLVLMSIGVNVTIQFTQ